ncbi:hypothetical protein MASR1M60_15030 [Rhodocyclaceae bacterium]
MTTFILVPTTQTPPQKGGLKDVVEKKFGNLAYSLPGGEWIVAFNGTSKQLSDDLGISEGGFGSVLVLNFSGYWGRASKDLWEWLDLNSK